MIGKSLPEYLFIRLCIVLFRLVAPLSIGYLVISAWFRQFLISPYLGLLALSETVFYLFIFLPRLHKLQLEPSHLPPPLTKSERHALFEKCYTHITDTDYPRGWFLQNEIRQTNVTEWILWALFSTPLLEAKPEWDDEIEEYIHRIEVITGKLPPGRCSSTLSIRLNFDPVLARHRPLAWYSIVMLVDVFTALRLYLLGFKHYSPAVFMNVFPPRPFTFLSRHSVNEHVAYWHFRAKNNGKSASGRPLVFLHGIGIGLHPYLPWFQELLSNGSTNDIVLIELLPICFHITDALPPRLVLLDAINQVLTQLNIIDAVLASHSYGTIVAAHIIRWQNTSSNEERETWSALSSISQFMLVDPIPFMLHLPDIAKNFLYRTPKEANEWQLWYFASTDPDVSRALGRHFFWQENILWKEDLFPRHLEENTSRHRHFVVVVAGEDQIIPSHSIFHYLSDSEGVSEKYRYEERLELVFRPGIDHAHIFETKDSRRLLSESYDRLCRIE